MPKTANPIGPRRPRRGRGRGPSRDVDPLAAPNESRRRRAAVAGHPSAGSRPIPWLPGWIRRLRGRPAGRLSVVDALIALGRAGDRAGAGAPGRCSRPGRGAEGISSSRCREQAPAGRHEAPVARGPRTPRGPPRGNERAARAQGESSGPRRARKRMPTWTRGAEDSDTGARGEDSDTDARSGPCGAPSSLSAGGIGAADGRPARASGGCIFWFVCGTHKQ